MRMFSRKESGYLGRAQGFLDENRATINANTPVRSIERNRTSPISVYVNVPFTRCVFELLLHPK